MKTKKTPTTGVFDENGHRVIRNKEINHRGRKLHQINPNVVRFNCVLPTEDAAKILQYCRGKEVKAEPIGNRAVRKPTRAMTPGDLMREYFRILTKEVILDAESLKWMDKQTKRLSAQRERQDAMVRAGINRIPKDQQLKRGGAPYSQTKRTK